MPVLGHILRLGQPPFASVSSTRADAHRASAGVYLELLEDLLLGLLAIRSDRTARARSGDGRVVRYPLICDTDTRTFGGRDRFFCDGGCCGEPPEAGIAARARAGRRVGALMPHGSDRIDRGSRRDGEQYEKERTGMVARRSGEDGGRREQAEDVRTATMPRWAVRAAGSGDNNDGSGPLSFSFPERSSTRTEEAAGDASDAAHEMTLAAGASKFARKLRIEMVIGDGQGGGLARTRRLDTVLALRPVARSTFLVHVDDRDSFERRGVTMRDEHIGDG